MLVFKHKSDSHSARPLYDSLHPPLDDVVSRMVPQRFEFLDLERVFFFVKQTTD